MSRRRSVLHSEKRHRTRNYKRRVKNLIIEIAIIILLIIVGIKFVKKDEEKPEITKITAEEQKEIIKEQLLQKPDNKKEKELILPEMKEQEIRITKATMIYQEQQQQTIISIETTNYCDYEVTNIIPINLVNNKGDILEKTEINIENLKPGESIRSTIVCEGNFSDAIKIELRDEKVN